MGFSFNPYSVRAEPVEALPFSYVLGIRTALRQAQGERLCIAQPIIGTPCTPTEAAVQSADLVLYRVRGLQRHVGIIELHELRVDVVHNVIRANVKDPKVANGGRSTDIAISWKSPLGDDEQPVIRESSKRFLIIEDRVPIVVAIVLPDLIPLLRARTTWSRVAGTTLDTRARTTALTLLKSPISPWMISMGSSILQA